MDGSRGAVDPGFEKGGFKIPDTVYLRQYNYSGAGEGGQGGATAPPPPLLDMIAP